MTSSNGSIFRVTGPLCGEFTGPGDFPTQRPVSRIFDVFFDLRLNKRLNKQPWGWWFETLSFSLWRHRNVRKSDGVRKLWCGKYWTYVCELSQTGKILGKCSWMHWKMSNQIRVFLATIVIGLTSDDTDYHVINMIVFICKWELCKRRNEDVFENNLIRWEILWKMYKDHIKSHVGSILKSKMIKSSGMKSDVVELHRLYLSLTSWNK